MSVLLSVCSLVLGVLGLQIYYWVTFVPAIGMNFVYRIGLWKTVVRVLVLGCALAAYAIHPTMGQLVVLGFALLLSIMTGFFFPPRAIPHVDRPRHLSAAQAPLADGAMVMGTTIGDRAAAWALETLIPHHLVNDELDGQPILASW